MSKFKKKDLVKYFDEMCLFLANHHWTERDERAVVIREMIQRYPTLEAIADLAKEWLEEKEAYVCMDLRRLEVLVEALKDSVRTSVAKIQKPEVMEEFVEKWNQVIAERVNVQMKKDFIREEIGLVYPGTENLTQMLEEAGVEVKEKK